MKPKSYYNEIDRHAAAWLRQLIAEKMIPDGEVDDRSITDVQADDLRGFDQCHFFAGIGGWPYALRLAGIPDDFKVWTGSCPCPPFSVAGKKKSCPDCGEVSLLPHPYRTGVFVCNGCRHEWHADDRHLWPEFHRLIRNGKPAIVFGEQVAGKDGEVWLAGVRATLEILGYGVGAANLGAHSAGGYHQRQRLYWMAYADRSGWTSGSAGFSPLGHGQTIGPDSGVSFMGDTKSHHQRRQRQSGSGDGREMPSGGSGSFIGMGNAGGKGLSSCQRQTLHGSRRSEKGRAIVQSIGSPTEIANHFDADNPDWRDADWIACRDSKWRPVEPGTFPLVDGLSKGVVRSGDPGAPIDANKTAEARVMRLKGYGNAIVPQLAAEFIAVMMEYLVPGESA